MRKWVKASTNGIVDALTRDQFEAEIEEMLKLPAFSDNEQLKNWFDSQKIFFLKDMVLKFD